MLRSFCALIETEWIVHKLIDKITWECNICEFYIVTLASRAVDSQDSASSEWLVAVSSDKQLVLSLHPQTLFLGVIIWSRPNTDYLRQHGVAVVITLSLCCWNSIEPNRGFTKRPLWVEHKHAGCKSRLGKWEKSSPQTCRFARKTEVCLRCEKRARVFVVEGECYQFSQMLMG